MLCSEWEEGYPRRYHRRNFLVDPVPDFSLAPAWTNAHPQNSIATTPCSKSRPRAISTGPLNALLRLHVPPIDVVVSHGPYSLEGMGSLISRWASRLDAFSGYPIQTWLISSAVGTTTDTPEVCSSRSSRTRDDPSQASNAHGG